MCGNIGRIGGIVYGCGCLFDFDEIYKVMVSVVMWVSFVDVIYVVGDFVGWILKLVVDFCFI